ncbi:unnamed protein product [Caenorhabditis angaria]|uniref:Uncharacterized protein n=1 Tax=Caenorhabditis angaria TaxID=860376 RepID=A0A9P1IRI1_9PELO|nr:unnamed protein product [Caenorhabditis angaria]
MSLDPCRFDEFIQTIFLIPGIWKKEFLLDDQHLTQVWKHISHTFSISEPEAQNQWNYLIHLHHLMHKSINSTAKFRFPDPISSEKWLPAETVLAQTLAPFFKEKLDEILIDK